MAATATDFPFDLRQLDFALFEWLRLGDRLGQAPYDELSRDVVQLVLEEAHKAIGGYVAPANLDADRIGARFERGAVTLPESMKQAWNAFREGGWHQLGVAPEYGGQGFPHSITTAVDEMVMAACPSFVFYPLLSRDSGRMIDAFGTPAQKEAFASRLFDAEWCGTMCLTEPGAGSDVGASTTRAERRDDGTYQISGSKCFITAADHDLTSNIIHLVLARTADAPPGTKGLSLFIVPKRWVDLEGGEDGQDNDVCVDGIESKMGIHGSATCSVTFGREGRCRGYLLGGEELRGIAQMFQMMNDARLDVGTSGAAAAGASYRAALDYAKSRIQGVRFEEMNKPNAEKVAIVEHPDVRRMLLMMKSAHAALQSIVLWTADRKDRAHTAASDEERAEFDEDVDLMTPILKAHCTEVGFEMASTGINVLGGYGYCRDYPLEQHCRDAKIGTIYEGTNHIQALDLIGRKLLMKGGRPFERFLARAESASASAKACGEPSLETAAIELSRSVEALREARTLFAQALGEGRLALIPLSANRFLEMMGAVACGWALLEQAVLAVRRLESLEENEADPAFYAGRVSVARFHAAHVLPTVASSLEVIRAGDLCPVEADLAIF
ncbi:MAG: acyl-CoA dehydrogenase [Myxococcota bacterium]